MLKISIIIPVHNAAFYLRECLASVRGQIFENWECICINDGSSDESGKILAEYEVADSRFRVVTQPTCMGVSRARNVGLALASGDYVAFVDADDAVSEKWLRKVVDKLVECPVDVLRSGFTHVYENRGKRLEEFSPVYCEDRESAIRVIWNRYLKHGQVWALVVKREIAQSVQFVPEMKLREDLAYLLMLTLHIQSFAQVQLYDYHYREGGVSACSKYYNAEEMRKFPQVIVAVWDRVVKVQQKCDIQQMATLVSNEIVRLFFEWLHKSRNNQLKEVDAFNGILKECRKRSLFQLSSFTGRWYPAWWYYRVCNSLLGFVVTERGLRWIRAMKAR